MCEQLTDEELAELRRLHSESTPGPWVADIASVHRNHGDGPPQAVVNRPDDEAESIAAEFRPGWDYRRICTNHDRGESNCVAGCYSTRGKLELEMRNAEFIAASHEAVLRLLDEVERLRLANKLQRLCKDGVDAIGDAVCPEWWRDEFVKAERAACSGILRDGILALDKKTGHYHPAGMERLALDNIRRVVVALQAEIDARGDSDG